MNALFAAPFTKAKPKPLPCHVAGPSQRGFTRLELAVLTGTVFLLLALALPALANKARFTQLACFNNLRQIGRAFHVWGNDHDNLFPMYVPPAQGGRGYTGGVTIPSWYHFGVLSNELGTARVLACPSDDKRPADDFSLDPDHGLFHANFRNSSVSYFLAHPSMRDPVGVLSGDRNIKPETLSISCSVLGNSVARVMPLVTPPVWTSSIHINRGHILHVDGHVELNDTTELGPVLRRTDTGNFHYLLP